MDSSFEFACISYEDADTALYYDKYLHKNELESIEKAVEKRRAEFLFGRICAKYAYAKLCGKSFFDNRILVQHDKNGAPFLCDGRYFVSITHDEKLAAAIVTDRRKLYAGIDVQKISPKNTDIIYKFIQDDEKELFENYAGQYGRDFLAAVMWVAKESASKLLGYGFSVYDALQISGFEKGEGLTVKFKDLSAFSVLIRCQSGYVFGFASLSKETENFCEKNLKIRSLPLNLF